MHFLLAALLCLVAAAPARAQTAPGPVLVVDGATSDGKPRNFTLAELEAFEKADFTTKTPWHNGDVKFEGLPMRALMKAVGANGKSVHVTAINNYVVEIPTSDFEQYPVVLAYKRDGKYMPVRDQGPFFIAYPYDSDPKLKSELYYSRSAWQIKTITIK